MSYLILIIMVKLVIPYYEKRRCINGQVFTVYLIEVYLNGVWHRIERRYRDFHQLHKEMKKLCPTPSFPPKKMRNLTNGVIEERRSQLEKYLQEMLINEVTRPQIFHFLCLPQEESTPKDHRSTESSWTELKHQAMIAFTNDLISSPSHCSSASSSTSSLPDIVLKGTLDAFYSNDDDFRY